MKDLLIGIQTFQVLAKRYLFLLFFITFIFTQFSLAIVRNDASENVRIYSKYSDKSLVVTTTGNVGIGITSPANKLSVVGDADFSGNVGIGTTSPGAKLHIYGSVANEDAIFFSDIGGNAGKIIGYGGTSTGTLRFFSGTNLEVFSIGAAQSKFRLFKNFEIGGNWISYDGNQNDGLTIDSNNNLIMMNGNVGIGTISPNYKLDVDGAVNATSVLINGVAVGAGGTQWASGSDGVISYTGGSVGIGKTSSGAQLHVYGGNDTTYIDVERIGCPGRFYSDGSSIALYSVANVPLRLGVNNNPDMVRITTIGNVGIGTILPLARLHVSGNVAGTPIMQIGNAVVPNALVVSANGNVGIGASVPNSALEINGAVQLNTTTSKPTCDVSKRGAFWVTQGGADVKDTVEVCAKDAGNAYAWRTLY